MAKSGKITTQIGTNGVYEFWMDWKVNSSNVASNTSNITVDLKARRSSGSASYGAYNLYSNNTIRLTVGGSVKVNDTSASIDLRTTTGVTLATWTGDVQHSADGTLALSLDGYFYFNASGASSLPKGGYTVSGTAILDTIPRKSPVSATDANVGSVSTILISRSSTTFTHTVTYSYGSASGTIATKTPSVSLPWTVPASFYGIMSGRTGTVTITCETYNGSVSLGTTTTTMTATAVDTVTVSGTVVDTNSTTIGLTGDSSKLIKFFSTAKATISAATNNSASITAKSINGTSVTSYLTIPNCEINAFTFYAKDSRDYYDYDYASAAMIPYIKLTNNATAERVTPTGNTVKLTFSGNYYNASFGAQSNAIVCKYRSCVSGGTMGAWTSITPTIGTDNTYTLDTTISGYNYQQTYQIEVQVSDALMTVSKTLQVVKGTPVFDWGEDDFAFNVPITFAGNIMPRDDCVSDIGSVAKMLSHIYAVGANIAEINTFRINGYPPWTSDNLPVSSGTWTPSSTALGFSGTGTYYRVGKKVFCHWEGTVSITGTGSAFFQSLPFTPDNNPTVKGEGAITFTNYCFYQSGNTSNPFYGVRLQPLTGGLVIFYGWAQGRMWQINTADMIKGSYNGTCEFDFSYTI